MNHTPYLAIVIPALAVVYLLIVYLLLGKAKKLNSYAFFGKGTKNDPLNLPADLSPSLKEKSVS